VSKFFIKIHFSFFIFLILGGQSFAENGLDGASLSNAAFRNDAAPIEILNSTVLQDVDYTPGHGFLIRKSNIVLDCNGMVLDGKGVAPFGVDIDSYGKSISNIVVKNCTFKNFKYRGASVGWQEKYSNKIKRINGRDDSELYAMHPKNIFFYNDTFSGSGTAGLYVDSFSQNVSIERSVFSDNFGVGIYLEFSSKRSRILNSFFSSNGFKKGRESIAIDSSSENYISGNYFKNNYAGSVFLYKNCGESFSGEEQFTRKNGANNNVIVGNSFLGEKIGVWVASRQSRDLSKWNCTDPSIYQGKYYQDYSNNNYISNNKFCGVVKPIILEDDNNHVESNVADVKRNSDFVEITTPPRAIYLKKPVLGNAVNDNTLMSCH
jgi:parallel beta-helix repeat protein